MSLNKPRYIQIRLYKPKPVCLSLSGLIRYTVFLGASNVLVIPKRLAPSSRWGAIRGFHAAWGGIQMKEQVYETGTKASQKQRRTTPEGY